jgi:hypothetical protein
MHVGVDQPRHDDPALRIHKLSGRVALPQLRGRANLGDQPIPDGDTSILNQWHSIVVRDQPPASDQQG